MSTFAERAVPFATCFNFRDMGGWRTADGRSLRWRTLYRSDTLHRLDGDELDLLAGLGLRTVIDLRTDQELTEHGRFRHAGPGLRHHHISLIDQADASAPETPQPRRSLGEGYVAMATDGQAAAVRAVEALAEPGGLPAVFHCTAGKDRTGILAAIVLSAIGVVEEDILADYELTAESQTARWAWLAVHDPAYLTFLQSLPPEVVQVRPEAIQMVLDRIVADHGSAAAYLVGGGLAPAALERLAEALLEG